MVNDRVSLLKDENVPKIFAKLVNENVRNPCHLIFGISENFEKFENSGLTSTYGQIHTFKKCIQNLPSTLRGRDKWLFVFLYIRDVRHIREVRHIRDVRHVHYVLEI